MIALAAAYGLLGLLTVVPHWPWLTLGLALLLTYAVGDLWLRALIGGRPAFVARLGLTTAAGLVSLPMVSLVLYVSGVPVDHDSLTAGLAGLSTALGLAGLVRWLLSRSSPSSSRDTGGDTVRVTLEGRRREVAAQVGAVVVPVVVALVIGGAAVVVYQRLPHPAEPGYTSLALGGWAANIDRPVAFPVGGLDVPLRISGEGESAALRIQVGPHRIDGPAVVVGADGTSNVDVHVPAPPDGCLHLIRISLGTASTVFYGRGPTPC